MRVCTVSGASFAFGRFGTRLFWGLFAFIGLAAIPIHAQTSIAGTVVGQVTDESGAVVPGVAVKIVDLGTSASFSTVTNDSGRYQFATVPPGKYDINFTKTGFSEFSI